MTDTLAQTGNAPELKDLYEIGEIPPAANPASVHPYGLRARCSAAKVGPGCDKRLTLARENCCVAAWLRMKRPSSAPTKKERLSFPNQPSSATFDR